MTKVFMFLIAVSASVFMQTAGAVTVNPQFSKYETEGIKNFLKNRDKNLNDSNIKIDALDIQLNNRYEGCFTGSADINLTNFKNKEGYAACTVTPRTKPCDSDGDGTPDENINQTRLVCEKEDGSNKYQVHVIPMDCCYTELKNKCEAKGGGWKFNPEDGHCDCDTSTHKNDGENNCCLIKDFNENAKKCTDNASMAVWKRICASHLGGEGKPSLKTGGCECDDEKGYKTVGKTCVKDNAPSPQVNDNQAAEKKCKEDAERGVEGAITNMANTCLDKGGNEKISCIEKDAAGYGKAFVEKNGCYSDAANLWQTEYDKYITGLKSKLQVEKQTAELNDEQKSTLTNFYKDITAAKEAFIKALGGDQK
jgi:hypothetical protein